MKGIAVCCFVCVSGLSTPALSQDGGGIPDSTRRRLADVVSTQSVVRAGTPWGPFEFAEPRMDADGLGYTRILGDISFLPDSIRIPRPVPYYAVTEMAVRRRQPLKWALVGGAAFSVIGVVLGAMDGATDDIQCFTCRETGLTPLTGAALFGGIGAGLGGAYGAIVPSWSTVYRNPRFR